MDLFDLNYRFAVQKLDPRIGHVAAYQVDRHPNEQSEIPIEMVNCTDLVDNEQWNVFLTDSVVKNLDDANFLCPNTSSLLVEGQHGDTNFSFIKVKVEACNSNKTEHECLDESKFNLTTLDFITTRTLIDLSKKGQDEIIQQYVDTSNYISFDGHHMKKTDLYYKKAEVNIDDSPVKLLSTK